jgi:hypothetical protein
VTDYYDVLEDRRLFHGILSQLYVARRQDVRNPGVGTAYLARGLGCSHTQLEFPLWYLKQRRWIEVLENGQLAITADGVDRLADGDSGIPAPQPQTAGAPKASARRRSKADTRPAEPERKPVAAEDSDSGRSPTSDEDLPDIETCLDEAFADDAPARS